MLSRALLSRTAGLTRVLLEQAKRRGHGHHAPVNPGPPVTFDYMPIPHQSYQKVYNELNNKFNTYLGISAVMLVVSFGAALYTDLWIMEALRPPLSWRERK